jgi:hypothetical protein
MEQVLTLTFITGLLAAMMRMATPIIFGTLGEILSERAGVLNLGIEGIMLMGAMTGFLTTLSTGSLWLGVAAAALIGALLALFMAFLAVYLGLSQHVSGLGITLLSTGLAMFIYRLSVGSPVNPPTVQPFTRVLQAIRGRSTGRTSFSSPLPLGVTEKSTRRFFPPQVKVRCAGAVSAMTEPFRTDHRHSLWSRIASNRSEASRTRRFAGFPGSMP